MPDLIIKDKDVAEILSGISHLRQNKYEELENLRKEVKGDLEKIDGRITGLDKSIQAINLQRAEEKGVSKTALWIMGGVATFLGGALKTIIERLFLGGLNG